MALTWDGAPTSRDVLLACTVWLVLTCALCAWPHPVASQQAPERGGVELGLSLSSFPPWHLTRNAAGTLRTSFRRQSLFGATLAVFPVRYVGVRGRVETVGVRIGSDRGFDLWKLGLEGRFVRLGPLTPFVMLEMGRLAETASFYMRFGNAGAGAILRVSDAMVLTVSAEVVWPISAGVRGNMGQPDRGLPADIGPEPFLPRVTIVWRPVRFNL